MRKIKATEEEGKVQKLQSIESVRRKNNYRSSGRGVPLGLNKSKKRTMQDLSHTEDVIASSAVVNDLVSKKARMECATGRPASRTFVNVTTVPEKNHEDSEDSSDGSSFSGKKPIQTPNNLRPSQQSPSVGSLDGYDGISFTDSEKSNGGYGEDTIIDGGGDNAEVVDSNDDDDDDESEDDLNDVDLVENITSAHDVSDSEGNGVDDTEEDGVNVASVVDYEKGGEDIDVDSAQSDSSDDQNPGDESTSFIGKGNDSGDDGSIGFDTRRIRRRSVDNNPLHADEIGTQRELMDGEEHGRVKKATKPTMNLIEMLRVQKHELLQRQICAPVLTNAVSRVHQDLGNCTPHSKSNSHEAEWQTYIDHLDLILPDFFTSDEAQMKERGASRRGRCAYASMKVRAHNCLDIEHAWKYYFSGKMINGPTASYNMFLAVVGQYMRFSVVWGYCGKENVWKEGMLYKSVLNQQSMEVFLNYFRLRGSVSGVQTKANQLSKLCGMARRFLQSKGDNLSAAKAALSQSYSSSVASGHKKLYRQITSANRDGEVRVAEGKLLRSEDFKDMIDISVKRLRGIMSSFTSWQEKLRSNGLDRMTALVRTERKLCKKEDIITKWCINFLALVMLQAGGQRPQVFWQLRSPTDDEMILFKGFSNKKQYLPLRTGVEKTSRDPRFPDVILPPVVFPFLDFHRNFILPHLIRKRSSMRGSDEDDCNGAEIGFNTSENERGAVPSFPDFLFLNTRTGHPLNTSSITRSFKTFAQNYDPELSSITSMSLRSCYATMMYNGYKKGQILKSKGEVEFLEFLGKVMNTSPEQLQSTYIALERSHFSSDARAVVKSFQTLLEQEDAESRFDIRENSGSQRPGMPSTISDLSNPAQDSGNDSGALSQLAEIFGA